jgi:serine O-acetyltransferase
MNVDVNNRIISFVLGKIQHYDPKKYWKLRSIVIDPSDRHSKLYKLLALMYIKRCDAYNCASTGTDLGRGAIFKTVPDLPHGLKGIIVHTRAKIGSNVTIYQHVTIGKNSDSGDVPTIGDNVIIGAGAAVLGETVRKLGTEIPPHN